MKSRERLLAALSSGVPDRVPVSTYELCGFNSKSFENNTPSYDRLMRYIREKTDCVTMWEPDSNEVFFQTAYCCPYKMDEIKDKDSVTKRYILETPKGTIKKTDKEYSNVMTTWHTEHWCKDIDDVDKVLSIPFEPITYDFSDFKRIKEEVDDNGIIMTSVGDALLNAVELMEFGEATVWALTETDHFAKTVEIMHERVMENLKRMLDEQVVDLYRICGPEYATIPYMSPQYFDRFVKPFVKEMVDLIHSKGAKARIHSHGKIKDVLKMILDTGADALDPCEAPPDGNISLREIKEAVSGKMCLFGNVQLKLLEHGSEQEIRETVKQCMDSAKAKGGYVIMPTAAPINIPLQPKTEENYFTYIDAALEYGKY